MAPLRAYDRELGRWISRHPIDVAGGINLYEYVSGDPINAVDPWGETPLLLMSPKAFFAGAAAVKNAGTAVVVPGRFGARWAVSAYRSWFGAAAKNPTPMAIGAIFGAAEPFTTEPFTGTDVTPSSIIQNAAMGALTGGLMGIAGTCKLTWQTQGLAYGTGHALGLGTFSVATYVGDAAGSQQGHGSAVTFDGWINEMRNNSFIGANRHYLAVPNE